CTLRCPRFSITCAPPGCASSASRRATPRLKTFSSRSPAEGFVTERRPPPSPLAQLTLARRRLFFREPSTIFWAFGFPIMLSIALGIAFRNRAPEPVRVAIEAGPGAEPALSAMTSPLVRATVEDAATASRWLRKGKVVLVVVPGDRKTVPYTSDLSLRS